MNNLRRFFKREIRTIIKPINDKSYNKVFCVGWLKTMTTSCGHALRTLGFKHKGWDPKVRLEREENSWFDSLKRFTQKRGGMPNKNQSIDYYRRHNTFIKNYFLGPGEGGADQLVGMNIIEDIPENNFPHISP